MRLYSWNVNGYRAVWKKPDFQQWLATCEGDVICLQETKTRPDQLTAAQREPEGYTAWFNPSKGKQGYSGTGCLVRKASGIEPVSVTTGLPDERYSGEGRTQCIEFADFYLFNIYFPNGQKNEERLAYKMGFYDAFLSYAEELRKTKPIVVCGDVNTAHTEIDLRHPGPNSKKSGFLPKERAWIDRFIAAGYVDTFRLFESEGDHYSWWDYRTKARETNAGWRIDYFFVSEELRGHVTRAWIESEVYGSDHCPVALELSVG